MLSEDEGTVNVQVEYAAKRIRRVMDRNNVGHPTIGWVVEDEKGWFAITHRDEMLRCDNLDAGIAHVAKKWRLMKS